jgi:hypothetical protein
MARRSREDKRREAVEGMSHEATSAGGARALPTRSRSVRRAAGRVRRARRRRGHGFGKGPLGTVNEAPL